MKITCVCPTYKRPRLLGRLIHCFLQQNDPNCELVILDDAGQYRPQEGERWRLHVTDRRYPNFGAKRNAVVSLVSDDTDGILCFDDDDVYWPHAVSSVAAALEQRPWAQCRTVYESAGPSMLQRTEAFGKRPHDWGYGGCWAWRKDAFWKVGGYYQADMGDDVGVAKKLLAAFGESADSSAGCEPWYWYNRDPGTNHISDEGSEFWSKRAELDGEFVEELSIGWNGPNVYDYELLPNVKERPW
jgi:glycosyltransferase involved in cell wall biosynthesis